MSILSAPAIAKWQADPQSCDVAVFLLKPTPVFSGQINYPNPTPFDYVVEFGIDNTTGSHASVYPGMTLILGSTPGGSDLGMQRVRVTPTANTMYCGASSKGTRPGELVVLNNAYFTVLNDYRVWTKVPRIDDLTGQMWKDYNLILQFPQPKANSGGGMMGYPTGGVLTVDFDGTQSYDLQDNSITHNWNFMDGTPGASISATPTGVTFPPGFRWVRHTIFAGTESHTMVIPVYCIDEDDDQFMGNSVQVVSHHHDLTGQEVRLRLLRDIDPSDFPDGTFMMMMDTEMWADGSTGPISVSKGPAGREHMLFCGWHHENPSNQIQGTSKGLRTNTTMQFLDIAGKLQSLPNWTQLVQRATDPSDWFEVSNLNINRELPDYLLRWHSTALEVADFHPYGTEYPVPTIDSDGGSLYDQVNSRMDTAIGCKLTCDREGALWILPDPQLLATASQASEFPGAMPQRTDEEYLPTLSEDTDWTDLQWADISHPRHHWLNSGAMASSTSDAADLQGGIATVFVIAPGTVPGQGLGAGSADQQVVNTVGEARLRAGNWYVAKLNAPQETFKITLLHNNRAGIDPAYLRWLPLTISSETRAERMLTFTNARMLPLSIDYQYNHKDSTRTQTLTLEREQWGYPATVLPQRENYAPPYTAPEVSVIEPVVSTFVEEDGSIPITLYVLHRTGRFFRGGWNGARFVFEEISPSSGQRTAICATGAAPTIASQFIFDPYNYKRCIIYASLGVAICEDITAASPVWTTVTGFLPSGVSYLVHGGVNGIVRGQIQGSGLRRNYFVWTYRPSTGDGVGVQYTTDNFATFSNLDLDTSDAYGLDFWNVAGITMSSHTAGKLWVGTGRDVYVSNNWAGSFAQETYPYGSTLADATGIWQPQLNMPFSLPGGGNNTGNARLVSMLRNPATADTYIAIDGRTPFVALDEFFVRPDGIHSFTLDANYIAAVGAGFGGSRFYVTETNGVSWATRTFPPGGGSTNYWGLNGWPGNHNFLLCYGKQTLCYTLDLGLTWNDALRTDFIADIGSGEDDDIFYAAGWLGDFYPSAGVHPA
jgi:hypothetical protein